MVKVDLRPAADIGEQKALSDSLPVLALSLNKL